MDTVLTDRMNTKKIISNKSEEKKKINKTKKLVNIHKKLGKIIKRKKVMKDKDMLTTLEKIQLKLLSVLASF